jgi:chemotaxis protein MotB
MKLIFFFILLSFCLFSCGIPKKDVLLLEDKYKNELIKLDSQLVDQRSFNYSLTLDNYKKQGSIAAYESVQKVYLDRLDSLQNEIDKLNKNSSLSQNFLSDNIDSLETKLANQYLFTQSILNYWTKFNSPVGKLSAILKDSLASEEDVIIEESTLYCSISIPMEKLFKPFVIQAVDPTAMPLLGKISEILQLFPAFTIQVIGHTDNAIQQNKKLPDNWDLSVLRASAVSKALVEEWQLSPSRILAAGKGEFRPMKSNETPEGKALNRRIELVVSLRTEDILREYKKLLPK